MAAPYHLMLLLTLLGTLPAEADWPEFRGPWGNGHVSPPGDTKPAGLPLTWSERQNVKWKTPIPHRGWSTPVVMGKQVWLTTATPDGHDFFAICVDADSGKVLSNEKMFHSDAPEVLGNDVNCYASPSPVIEPGRVYVQFGSYGTACLDTETRKVIWKRDDLPCRHFRGPGSSPVLFKNLLILTMDGVNTQYVTALDKQTGRSIWKTDRTTEWNDLGADGKPAGDGDFRKAFSTPLIFEAAGLMQMISAGSKAAYSYDPSDGRELWRIKLAGHTTAVRPVFGRGLVFLASGQGKTEMLAVRPEGHGDVTGTQIAWQSGRGAPRMPSPLLVDDLLYLLGDSGVVRCVEAATGNEVWQERIGGEYYASPVCADGNIYCFSRQGKTTVLKAGRSLEVRATNTLEDGFMASPAVSGKAFFLRTKTNLYRIEADEGVGASSGK